MPLVSILIPVFNTATYVRQTIRSALAQTMTDLELIAIDDGSSDGSGEILKELARQEPRMQVVARENRGLVATRNELLAIARGDFIAWLDSDDLATPDRLAVQLARFEREPGLLCLGGAAILTDPVGLPILKNAFAENHDELVKAMEKEIAFYFPAVTMRRDAAIKAGGFRDPFAISEDYDLCLRLSEVGRVGNVPQVVLFYRQHMASTANSGRGKTNAYSAAVRAMAKQRRETGSDQLQRGEKLEISFEKQPSARQNEYGTYSRWAWWALRDGHLKTARKYAAKVLMARPWSADAWRLMACALRGR